MAFINTEITPEMVKKYDMEQDYQILVKHRNKGFYRYGVQDYYCGSTPFTYIHLRNCESKDIFINEEGNCYLRYGCIGFSEAIGVTGHSYFLLYWQGQRIYLVIKTELKHSDEKNKTSHSERYLFQICSLQPVMLNQDLYQAIEESLNVYYESLHWKYINTFNFSLIK